MVCVCAARVFGALGMVDKNELATVTLEQPEERASRVKKFKTQKELQIEAMQAQLKAERDAADAVNKEALDALYTKPTEASLAAFYVENKRFKEAQQVRARCRHQ